MLTNAEYSPDILRELRLKSGLTQQWVARNVGVSRQVIHTAETSSVSYRILRALAHLYKVEIRVVMLPLNAQKETSDQ